MEFDLASAILTALNVALANFAAHWVPWGAFRFFVDREGRLLRLPAYAYGVLTILGGATVTIAIAGAPPIPALWGIACAAGLGTMAAYGLEALEERQIQRRDAEIIEGGG